MTNRKNVDFGKTCGYLAGRACQSEKMIGLLSCILGIVGSNVLMV